MLGEQEKNEPQEQKAKVEYVTDGNGTKYKIGKFLGGGIEGRTFEAEVVSVGQNADPRLKVGVVVAMKQQRFEKHKELDLDREKAILAKEGSLFGVKKESTPDGEYLYMAIPVIKGKNLRDMMYDIQGDTYVAKKDLTLEQKKSISYSLLKDYYAQQLLSILHVDIKTDNILVDSQGKAKVIDFGNSWDRDASRKHPAGFQSPGILFSAPEQFAKGKNQSNTECTPMADQYAMAVMLASIWSTSAYEKDADFNADPTNPVLSVRQTLNDILGDPPKKPSDMPDDLFQIIRHLGSVNPQDRPENIALARGLSQSTEPMLQDIVKAQNAMNAVFQQMASELLQDFRKIAQNNKNEKLFDEAIKSGATDASRVHRELVENMDDLREIVTTLTSAAMRTKDLRIRCTAEFEAIIKEMANSPDPNVRKIVENVPTEGKIEDRLPLIQANYDKYSPKVLENAIKNQSLEAEVYSRVDALLKSTQDPATIRIGLHEIYGDIIVMATKVKDQNQARVCKDLANRLVTMLDKVDQAREIQAHMLQGRPPVVLPQVVGTPDKTQKETRKSGRVQRLVNYLRKKMFEEKKEEPVNPLDLTSRLSAMLQTKPVSTPVESTPSPTTLYTVKQGVSDFVRELQSTLNRHYENAKEDIKIITGVLNYLRNNPLIDPHNPNDMRRLAECVQNLEKAAPKENRSPSSERALQVLREKLGKTPVPEQEQTKRTQQLH